MDAYHEALMDLSNLGLTLIYEYRSVYMPYSNGEFNNPDFTKKLSEKYTPEEIKEINKLIDKMQSIERFYFDTIVAEANETCDYLLDYLVVLEGGVPSKLRLDSERYKALVRKYGISHQEVINSLDSIREHLQELYKRHPKLCKLI